MRKVNSVRFISALLALLMILTIFTAISVSADSVGGEDRNIVWAYVTDTKTLTISGEGEMPVYEYPDVEPWFEYSMDIKGIVIEEGITSVPDFAFQNNYDSVSSLMLADSVKSIGKQAFEYCDDLSYVDFGSGIQTIGDMAFGNTDVSSLVFPNSLQSIGKMAFYECGKLAHVNLGCGVTTIGELAFESTAMKSVEIPDNVLKIGKRAFGYTYEEPDNDDGTTALYGYYPIKYFEVYASKGSVGANYAAENGFTLVSGPAAISATSLKLQPGTIKTLKVSNAAVVKWTNNAKSVAVYKNGKIYALKKGTTVITAKTVGNKTFSCKVTVTANPALKIGSSAFKAAKTYTVKKGKYITVSITGKSSAVNNSYLSSKPSVARVVSKVNASKVKIKGFLPGSGVVAVKVNGVAYKIKIKVKK